MSTSLLYHAFGIRGYQYVRTDYPDGQVIFTIRQESKTCRCSACGSTRVQSRGHVERRFRSLPIGSRTTAVVLPIPRVECRACGVVRQVGAPFADPRRTYTKAFERSAVELSRRMTIQWLSLVDEYTRECLALEARRGMTADEIRVILAGVAAKRGGPPHRVRSDNGPEFAADAVRSWLEESGAGALYVAPASPWQNGYAESFHSKLRDEFLDREEFESQPQAQGIGRD